MTAIPSSEVMAELEESLADLYPDLQAAQRIVRAAGLDHRNIPWTGSPRDIWHAILTEAKKQSAVPRIVDCARREYPRREDLLRLVGHLDPREAHPSGELGPCADRWLRSADIVSPLHVQLDASQAPPVVVAPATSLWNHRGVMNVPEIQGEGEPAAPRLLEEIADERPIFVLRGPPGAGKSTACGLLGRRWAKSLLDGTPGTPVPVLVELRDFACNPGEPPVEALERLVAWWLREWRAVDPAEAISAQSGRRYLEHGLYGRPLAVYFDGLNEVSAANSAAAHDALHRLLDRLRGTKTRAVITTRRHGAEVRALGQLDVFDVQPLSGAQIRQYLAQRLEWPMEKVAELYEKKLGDRIRIAAGNPLALNLLASILASKRPVPSSRGDLFAAFVTDMLEREEKEKLGDYPHRRFGLDIKRAALQELAYSMQSFGRAMPRGAATTALARGVGADDEDEAHALLDELCCNDLLTLREGDVAFSYHHTFQEYFCAASLLGRHRENRLDAESIAADPRWWEPFGMVGGLARDEKELDAVVERVHAHPPLAGMLLGNARPGSKVEKRFLARARRSLERGIRMTVLSTQTALWLAAVFAVGAVILLPMPDTLRRLPILLGVDPLDGLPVYWTAVWASLVFFGAIALLEAIEGKVTQLHDRALGGAYDRWVEPWLLALYYLNSPDADLALRQAHEAHGARRAVDLRLRRYLEAFSSRTLIPDPEVLCAWLDDPMRAELAVVFLGATYHPEIAERILAKAQTARNPRGPEMDVIAEWLARRPEAREPLAALLVEKIRDDGADVRFRRALSRLLRENTVDAPKVPLTPTEIVEAVLAPAIVTYRSMMTLLIFGPAMLARPRTLAPLRKLLRAWCSSMILRPGVSGLEAVIDVLIAAKESGPAAELLDAALAAHPAHAGLWSSRGNLLHNLRRQYSEAALAFTEALRLNPDSAPLLGNRAISLRAAGRVDQALRDARRALEIAPDAPERWRTLVDTLIDGDVADEAETKLAEALTRFPKDLGLHESRGRLLHNLRRQYSEAVLAYTEALRLNPDSAPMLRSRAISLLAAGRVDQALRDARRALEIAPDTPRSWEILVEMLISGKMADEAETKLADALARFPKDPDLHGSRGRLLHNLRRQYSEAALAYTEALRLNPDSAPMLRSRAISLLAAGRVDQALRDARRALEIAPDTPRSWEILVETLISGEMADEAETKLADALTKFPKDPDLHGSRGRLLHNLRRQYSEAALAYTEALRLNPDSAPMLRSRAISLLAAGRVDQALRDARRALEIAPGAPRSWEILIDTLITGKLADEAEMKLAEALTRFPEDPGLHESRGHLLHNLRRQYAEAALAFTEALRLNAGSAVVLRNRAACLLEAGQLDAAASDIELAASLDPASWRTRERRVCLAMSRGALDSAAELLVDIEEGDARDLLLTRAELRLASGEPRGAAADLLEYRARCGADSIVVSPLHREAVDLLRAETMLRLGQTSESLTALKGIESPTDPIWVAFLVHLAGGDFSPQHGQLVDKHLAVQALRDGKAPLPAVDLPRDGVRRLTRQAGLVLDTHIARLERRAEEDIADLQQRALALAVSDHRRIEALLVGEPRSTDLVTEKP